MVPPGSHRVVDRGTQVLTRLTSDFAYRTFTFFGISFQKFLLSSVNAMSWVLQPSTMIPKDQSEVWALTVSLSATKVIFVNLFSSPYLDVSVRGVTIYAIIILVNQKFGCKITSYETGWVSPFGYRRIKGFWLLPDAFRAPYTSFFGNVRQGIRCLH